MLRRVPVAKAELPDIPTEDVEDRTYCEVGALGNIANANHCIFCHSCAVN